jgi:hypothetical protein
LKGLPVYNLVANWAFDSTAAATNTLLYSHLEIIAYDISLMAYGVLTLIVWITLRAGLQHYLDTLSAAAASKVVSSTNAPSDRASDVGGAAPPPPPTSHPSSMIKIDEHRPGLAFATPAPAPSPSLTPTPAQTPAIQSQLTLSTAQLRAALRTLSITCAVGLLCATGVLVLTLSSTLPALISGDDLHQPLPPVDSSDAVLMAASSLVPENIFLALLVWMSWPPSSTEPASTAAYNAGNPKIAVVPALDSDATAPIASSLLTSTGATGQGSHQVMAVGEFRIPASLPGAAPESSLLSVPNQSHQVTTGSMVSATPLKVPHVSAVVNSL